MSRRINTDYEPPKPDPTLRSTIQACNEYDFSEDITREVLWNTAYQLGRKRWYWGPNWLVNLTGWVNTRWSLFKALLKGGAVKYLGHYHLPKAVSHYWWLGFWTYKYFEGERNSPTVFNVRILGHTFRWRTA